MDPNCIFCKIASGQMQANLVHEDERSVAFMDINPQAPMHLLVIPREHIESVSALSPESDELVGHLFRVAAKLAKDNGVGDGGYRTVINTGPDAGQTVFHIHVHVLGGRSLGWPPG